MPLESLSNFVKTYAAHGDEIAVRQRRGYRMETCAAGGISNLYYPAQDRNDVGLVFSNALIRLGETAVANIFQEFIAPKLTPNLPRRAPAPGQP